MSRSKRVDVGVGYEDARCPAYWTLSFFQVTDQWILTFPPLSAYLGMGLNKDDFLENRMLLYERSDDRDIRPALQRLAYLSNHKLTRLLSSHFLLDRYSKFVEFTAPDVSEDRSDEHAVSIARSSSRRCL